MKTGSCWKLYHGSLNVPIEHHPTIRYMVYNGYYKVMSNSPKMGHLPIPVWTWICSVSGGVVHPIPLGVKDLVEWCRMCMRFGQLRGTPIMLGCKLPEQCLCNAVCWGFETIILELLGCTESHIFTRMRSYYVKKIQTPTGPTGAKLPLKSLLCFNISKHVWQFWHLSAKYTHRSVQNPFRYWHPCACHAPKTDSPGQIQEALAVGQVKWAKGLDRRNRFYHLLANRS